MPTPGLPAVVVPILGDAAAEIPRNEEAEEERVPGLDRSPTRTFCPSISMNGTLPPSFCVMRKPAIVVTNDGSSYRR